MKPCILALCAIAATMTAIADAATFKCGVSWRVDGKVLWEGDVAGTPCQAKCESIAACQYFYTTEDVNTQSRVHCYVMGDIYGKKYRDDAVIVICGYPRVWPKLGITANFAGGTGTFAPANPATGKTGSYHRVASSTGVIGIHVTMIPDTDDVVMFGRPQDPTHFPPQPGMEIDNTGVEWPSSIVNAHTGSYYPVTWNVGAPFCAHQVHTVNGDILVCGGDDNYIGKPGNGDWGGYKGCRYMTKNNAGQRVWYKFGDLSGGHWYPSMVELPPRVSGSKGTCALVIGGLMNVGPDTKTDHADMACLQMGLVFGGSVYDVGSTPNVAASLTGLFPISYLLPVGDVPAAPQLFLLGELAGDVVTVSMDFTAYTFRLTSIKYIPPAPIAAFTFNAASSSVLRAVDLARPVTKDTVEVIIFGGAFNAYGLPASDKAFRIKPLADNPTWEQENMPSPAVMRWAINLPNGKVLLMGGARHGKAGGGAACCTSTAGGPIMSAWIYNPAAPPGRRWWVDPLMMPRFRLYHNNAWLALDGSIGIAGGDQAVSPNNRPDFTMDSYVTPALRKASKAGTRPAIIASPRSFKYGAKLTIKMRGGYASRCSLSKPVAATHATASSHRMLILKTLNNAMNKVEVKKGGYLVVGTFNSAYVAPPGWWLIYCWHGDVWTAGKWIYLNAK